MITCLLAKSKHCGIISHLSKVSGIEDYGIISHLSKVPGMEDCGIISHLSKVTGMEECYASTPCMGWMGEFPISCCQPYSLIWALD